MTSSMVPTVEAAAANNAAWCDALCWSHGLRGHVDGRVWSSARRTPTTYPDAVTLRADVSSGEILPRVDGSAGCSVKDSFGTLDLSDAGFDVLFEAEWIACDVPEPGRSSVDWRSVTDAEGLRVWSAARGDEPGLLRPELLTEPGVAVLGGYADGRLAGGALANLDGGVVGLSNVFATTGELDEIWAGAPAAASDRFGGVPVVGYESGTDLDTALRHGFRPLGGLRVWLQATS